MTITFYEISTYEKMNHELKNVQNILGILLKTILKFRNNRFYKNFYSKNRIFFYILNTFFGCFWRKINIDNTSENIKCKKNRVIYHYKEKRVTI